jgi:hypothetical protein
LPKYKYPNSIQVSTLVDSIQNQNANVLAKTNKEYAVLYLHNMAMAIGKNKPK